MFGFLMALLFQVPGPARPAEEPVSYDISVRLEPESKTLQGTQVLRYTNTSPDIIATLQFHAYYNAALNSRSTYMVENRRKPGGDDQYGYCHIQKLQVGDDDLTSRIRWLQTEAATAEDRTVFEVPLSAPLMPGETLSITTRFEALVPDNLERTGFVDDYFFIAQWYPKIGVWETRGTRGREQAGWNCHAYHSDTEYYAPFGSYRVRITLPEHFEVGATGRAVGTPERRDNLLTHTYEQDHVHDFAWTAWPGFIRKERLFEPDVETLAPALALYSELFGLSQEAITPGPVKMTLLLSPEHEGDADRFFAALEQGLTWFGIWLTPYPYDTLTAVEPPRKDRVSGGMEYPTLITLGTSFHNPKGHYGLEDLVFHELAHQYFYGLVATNEVEDAWMDEGFTSYITNRLLSQAYGREREYHSLTGNDLLPPFAGMLGTRSRYSALYAARIRYPAPLYYAGFSPAPFAEGTRNMAVFEQGRDPMASRGWAYYPPYGYTLNAYSKPATMLEQLRLEIGDETMARLLNQWVRRFAFQHPGPADFTALAEEICGREMDWFFEPLLKGTGQLDFRVGPRYSVDLRIHGRQLEADGPGWIPAEGREDPEKFRRHHIVVEKKGALSYPVDVLMVFSDGEEVRRRWAGDAPWFRFSIDNNSTLTRVVIDPDRKVLLERNRFNNAWILHGDSTTSNKLNTSLMVWAQNLVQTLLGGL